MKSSWIPFMLGGATVFGMIVLLRNQRAMDKLMCTMSDATENAIQKFKEKVDSMTCCTEGHGN